MYACEYSINHIRELTFDYLGFLKNPNHTYVLSTCSYPIISKKITAYEVILLVCLVILKLR